MKYFLQLLVTAVAVSTFAQETQSTRTLERYTKTLDSLRKATPHYDNIRRQADAFGRAEHVKVCLALGIDPSDPIFTGGLSDMQEQQWGDTTFRKNVSNNNNDQEETSIAINRVNKKYIVAGANDASMYTSGMPSYNTTNGGLTWATNRVSMAGSGYIALGDPMIVSDDQGNFYYAFLAMEQQSGNSNLLVATSKYGKQWTRGNPVIQPQTTDYFEDKEHIAVDTDPSSPYYGRLYIVWMRFDQSAGDGSGIHLCYSDDKGMSWSTPQVIFPGSGQFSQIRVGPKGVVYISFSTGIGGDVGDHVFFRSTDGGKSFVGVTRIAEYISYPYNNDGRPSIKGDEGFRSYPVTAFDVDQTSGRIHFVFCSWNDFAASMYYTYSTDQGEEWSEPIIIGVNHPDNPIVERDRFMPWVSIDQKTRTPYAFYYSSEDDEDNILTTVFRVVLDERGESIPERVGGTSFDPMVMNLGGQRALPFIGDYIGCDAYDSVFAAAWAETRPNRNVGDVFAAVIVPVYKDTSSTSDVPVSMLVSSDRLSIGSIYPNPVSGGNITVQFVVPKRTDISMSIVNTNGQSVRTFAPQSFEQGAYCEALDITALPKGMYFVRIESSAETASMPFVIE